MKAFEKLHERYRFVRPSRRILMAIIDAVGGWFVRLFAGRKTPPSLDADQIRRIVVIQLDHLGDAVITTSMFAALRRRFPHATIDVLAAPWNWEVFAATKHVARIMISGCNRFRRGRSWLWPLGLVAWSWKLRRAKYDLAIDPRGDFLSVAMMRAAGIPRRVGWACSGGGFWLTLSAGYEAGRAEVLSRRALLGCLEIRPSADQSPVIHSRPEDDDFIAHMLGEARRSDRPLLVMHVGAGTRAKSWPIEHWRELLGRVIVELNARVVLVGSEADRRIATEITENMFWPGVMDWTGRLTVAQLAALARRSALFIGGDSGPAHVAAAAGARVIALFSGINASQQWRPWGDRVTVLSQPVACSPCYANECRFDHHSCMRDLLPERVVDAIDAALHGTAIMAGPHFLKFELPADKKGRSS
jgi:lipopolysaccharide heptosyltransferase II